MPNKITYEEIENLIARLNDEEEKVFKILSKLNISLNKNINENTIRKNLVGKDYGSLDVKNILRQLKNKGLVKKYRKENWELTTLGFKISQHFRFKYTEDIKNKYGLSSILKRG